VSSFAEEAVVPASGAIKVRDDAPLEVIALVGCAVATGVGAVTNTAAVEPGAQVAVIGCGGVGLSVIQGVRTANFHDHEGSAVRTDCEPFVIMK
jgi:S-(hydroxymethyl)glutathione dehydrogenase / alcohol dehydrogenase